MQTSFWCMFQVSTDRKSIYQTSWMKKSWNMSVQNERNDMNSILCWNYCFLELLQYICAPFHVIHSNQCVKIKWFGTVLCVAEWMVNHTNKIAFTVIASYLIFVLSFWISYCESMNWKKVWPQSFAIMEQLFWLQYRWDITRTHSNKFSHPF